MNDVEELKQYVQVHARASNIRGYREVLARIRHDDGAEPGSWAAEWSREAARYEAAGRHLEACRNYAMARFPYVDGPARQDALDRSVGAFDAWRRGRGGGPEPIVVEVHGCRVRCWADGLSAAGKPGKKPLLLVMGGIVSTKEQWAQALPELRRLGMAVVAAELPGVGENPLTYGAESWRMLAAVLDAVADRADVSETYALASSFSGHLALRCAARDGRIRGVITIGAPVSRFFTDAVWQRRLPRVTVDTLAHLTGADAEKLPALLRDWRLDESELFSLDIPVCYLASKRDEIIPGGEKDVLRQYVSQLRLIENDDVHASPGHVVESKLWSVLSLLRMRGSSPAQRVVLGGIWWTLRARGRLLRSAG